MSRKPYSWLVVVGMISLCIGLSGCGKNVDTVAESTVPIEIGEHVMYGSYQGEPVEWRVLDKKDGEILLLSEYGLDILPFDDSGSGSIIWENSSIRNWLNNEFYNSTFSKEEQENILVDLLGVKTQRAAALSILNMGVSIMEILTLFASAVLTAVGIGWCFIGVGMLLIICMLCIFGIDNQ